MMMILLLKVLGRRRLALGVLPFGLLLPCFFTRIPSLFPSQQGCLLGRLGGALLALLVLLAGGGGGLVAAHAGNVVGIVDVPGLFAEELSVFGG